MTRKYHKDGTLPDGPAVWVFGSNTLGHHAAGAARVAVEKFGMKHGIEAGLHRNAYAIPTIVGSTGDQLPLTAINYHVAYLLNHVGALPDTEFFITRIGCGLAGFTDAQIAPMFKHAPLNCNLPEEWKEFVE